MLTLVKSGIKQGRSEMAATIAWATGNDNNRSKTVHRLGSQSARVTAATWRTEATAYVARDGSGYVEVLKKNSGDLIHSYRFGPESER